jgi:nucleoside-diphosphate-sugar epimerase
VGVAEGKNSTDFWSRGHASGGSRRRSDGARSGPRKLRRQGSSRWCRSAEQAKSRFHHWLQDDGFSLLVQDVTQSLPHDLKPQLIIHAASPASPKFYRPDPVGTMLPNVVGTLNLLNLARQARTERFLFFSSAEVYGLFRDPPAAIDETSYGSLDPNDNRSCYAESKRMGEALCSAYALQYGVAATIVRPFHTYGPGMKLNDGRVFADFIRDVVTGQEITLKGDGKDRRSFCYLSDATEAFLHILLHGRPGQAYNVGNPSGLNFDRRSGPTPGRLFSKRPPQMGQASSSAGGKRTGNVRSHVSRYREGQSRGMVADDRPRRGLSSHNRLLSGHRSQQSGS